MFSSACANITSLVPSHKKGIRVFTFLLIHLSWSRFWWSNLILAKILCEYFNTASTRDPAFKSSLSTRLLLSGIVPTISTSKPSSTECLCMSLTTCDLWMPLMAGFGFFCSSYVPRNKTILNCVCMKLNYMIKSIPFKNCCMLNC